MLSPIALSAILGNAEQEGECVNTSPCQVGCDNTCTLGTSCFYYANNAGTCASGTHTCDPVLYNVKCWFKIWDTHNCTGNCIDTGFYYRNACSPNTQLGPSCPGGGG